MCIRDRIYASKEDALREFGGKSFTAATRKKAEDCMRGEVECYDSYLRGEAYGSELYKDGALEDSCWGFIGSNEEALKGIEDYLPDELSLIHILSKISLHKAWIIW